MKYVIPIEIHNYIKIEADNFKDAISRIIENRNIISTKINNKDSVYKIDGENNIRGFDFENDYIDKLEKELLIHGYGNPIKESEDELER